MNSARDAAAITTVAAQPQIAIDRDSVSRPMTLGLRTISIITAISGADGFVILVLSLIDQPIAVRGLVVRTDTKRKCL